MAPLWCLYNELMPKTIIFSYIYLIYYVVNNFHVITTKLIFSGNIHTLMPLHLWKWNTKKLLQLFCFLMYGCLFFLSNCKKKILKKNIWITHSSIFSLKITIKKLSHITPYVITLQGPNSTTLEQLLKSESILDWLWHHEIQNLWLE